MSATLWSWGSKSERGIQCNFMWLWKENTIFLPMPPAKPLRGNGRVLAVLIADQDDLQRAREAGSASRPTGLVLSSKPFSWQGGLPGNESVQRYPDKCLQFLILYFCDKKCSIHTMSLFSYFWPSLLTPSTQSWSILDKPGGLEADLSWLCSIH